MHLLELLIQNGGDILQDYLILIDPLPNIPHVNSISKTLDTLKQSSLEEESSVDKVRSNIICICQASCIIKCTCQGSCIIKLHVRVLVLLNEHVRVLGYFF